MDMDDPLDFELEDSLRQSPVVAKRRKKLIGLDDLLTDHYNEENKKLERESKRAKTQKKNYDSDEDAREARLFRLVDKCHTQMNEMGSEDDVSPWGIRVFGNEKAAPHLSFPELGSRMLFKPVMNNKLNSMVELTTDKAESFLEGLLLNSWLIKMVFTYGHLEKSVATWAFNLMLYSPKEELRTSACDFWFAILLSEKVVDALPIKMDWLPSYSELKNALQIYGYLSLLSSNSNSEENDSKYDGPPQNIIAWIKFAAACCKVRNKQSLFATSEVEELLEVIISLFLDRQLLGLSVLLYESMLSAISYFTDLEWKTSCGKVAKSLACRVPCDANCLRLVECMSGVNIRTKHLRNAVAYQMLICCFDNKATNEGEILRLLISINVKDKSCDLFKVYIYLVLTENWLLSNPLLEENQVLYEMLGLYLRNLSFHISGTDLRSYAAKVRSRASYLKQGMTS